MSDNTVPRSTRIDRRADEAAIRDLLARQINRWDAGRQREDPILHLMR
jgi:hypothetical protein